MLYNLLIRFLTIILDMVVPDLTLSGKLYDCWDKVKMVEEYIGMSIVKLESVL